MTALLPGIPEPDRRRRGRGATPRVERFEQLDRPNRFGRRRLRYRYRPLRDWTAEEIDLAERGLRYYFRRVGGFALVDDALMRAFIATLRRLASDATELATTPATLVRWAIDSKAASLEGRTPEESRDKRRFVGRPENFFLRDLDRWLDLSPDRARQAARLAERARAERARAQSDRFHAERRRAREQQQRRREDAERRRRGELTAEELRLLQAWRRMPVGRQIIAMRATDRAWRDLCRADGVDPGSDRGKDRHRILAARYACDAWGDPQRSKEAPDVPA